MISNEYVIAGVGLFSAGLIAIGCWLIRSYKILIDENERLKDDITQLDDEVMEADILVSDLQDRIEELQGYIHDYGSEWNTYGQAREDPEDPSHTPVLPSVLEEDAGRGRHAR